MMLNGAQNDCPSGERAVCDTGICPPPSSFTSACGFQVQDLAEELVSKAHRLLYRSSCG